MSTFEWLGAGMFAVVSCKFIGPCKSPLASFPGTFVGFLTCKNKSRNEKELLNYIAKKICNAMKLSKDNQGRNQNSKMKDDPIGAR